VREVDNLVITAVEQGVNSLADFDIAHAVKAVTTKLVGYTETVRVLRDRFTPGASVVLFGGLAKERPYPGSTVVTTFNGGITAFHGSSVIADAAVSTREAAERIALLRKALGA
jgi:hypothetical protein